MRGIKKSRYDFRPDWTGLRVRAWFTNVAKTVTHSTVGTVLDDTRHYVMIGENERPIEIPRTCIVKLEEVQ